MALGVKRLFLAVDIDEATREAIGRVASELRQRIDRDVKATWVKPDRMHLTLHFFGEADARTEERIHAALERPMRQPAFQISFAGLGFFPERGAPRVLWLGIREGADQLRAIHAVLAERLKVQDGSFKPHLTLARVRDRVRPAQIREISGIPASAGPCPIDRVTLYESRLSPAGPTYLRLGEAPLS